MEKIQRNITLFVAALAALLLQISVAPVLSIEVIQPNIVIAFCAVLAIVRPQNGAIVTAFIMGLLADLAGFHTVGLLAGVLVVISFALTRIFSVLDNEKLFMPVVALALAVLVGELGYAFLLTQADMSIGFGSLVLYRAAPCALYDFVVSLILYPLVMRFVGPGDTAAPIPVAQQIL